MITNWCGEARIGDHVQEGTATANGSAVLGVGAELAGGEALGALAEIVGLAQGGAIAVELRCDLSAFLADTHGSRDREGAVPTGTCEV